MGLFVTLEGGEGAGKSSQALALSERLQASGLPVVRTREPGGTALGERVRDIVLDVAGRGAPLEPLTEALLFAGARAQLVAEVIAPALARGDAVVCDRFADSTVAYQGYGRGVDLDAIAKLNEVATAGVRPDLTVLLDLPVAEGLARTDGEQADRFEREHSEFHERVRDGYRRLAEREPERWLVVDASEPVEAVTDAIWARLAPLLDTRRS